MFHMVIRIREQAQAQNQNDAKIYFENPFVSRLLKQDGERGIDEPTGMKKVVENYMEHDMVTSISIIVSSGFSILLIIHNYACLQINHNVHCRYTFR
jgi:hypothetical protein